MSVTRLFHWTCEGCDREETKLGFGLPDGWEVLHQWHRGLIHRCDYCQAIGRLIPDYGPITFSPDRAAMRSIDGQPHTWAVMAPPRSCRCCGYTFPVTNYLQLAWQGGGTLTGTWTCPACVPAEGWDTHVPARTPRNH